MLDELELGVVDILVFVHQEVSCFCSPLRGQVGVISQQFAGKHDLVVMIDSRTASDNLYVLCTHTAARLPLSRGTPSAVTAPPAQIGFFPMVSVPCDEV